MARPIKWRRIEQIPPVQSFVPADDKGDTRVNTLKLEEVEALRLKDQSAHVVCGRGRRAMCRNRCRRGGPFRDISDD